MSDDGMILVADDASVKKKMLFPMEIIKYNM